MKKLVCFSLVAVLLFTLSFSCFAASSIVLSFSKDIVLSYVSSIISSYSNSIEQRTEAARGAYFNFIAEDKLNSGYTIFDSSGQKFTDEILDFYYDYYVQTVDSKSDYYDSNYDIFIQAAGFPDTPFSLSLLGFYYKMYDSESTQSILKTSMQKFFNDYYQSYLARYLIAQGETATDPNPGKSGLDIAPAYVTSEELIEGIQKDNSVFSPKGELSKISYRTDETFQKYINFPTTARTDYYKPYIVDNNNFVHVGSTSSNSLYFVLFFKDTKEYVSEYQFRLYFDSRAVDAADGTKDFVTYPRLQIWSNVDGTPSEPIDFLDGTVDCSDYKYYYLDFSSSSTYFRFYGFKTYSDYLNNRAGTVFQKSYFTNYYSELFLSDFSSSVKFENMINKDTSHSFKGSYSYHDKTCSCPLGGKDDIGLYVSAHPIEFTYADIDTSKIPTGQIVTINGDTIYNYTITNPDTGDSSKFGDYITNNYTYVTNNYGGSSSGSGVGGNVTVGGSIDVGGSVGVDITVSVPDININVNGNGSGAGGSGSSIANPDDFTSAESVDLTKYYDEAVEQSTGFQKFLKDFFGFLPAELLALILFAVAMAIVCRVFGR